MSTATEDVLRHVIHDVVHQATQVLKTHRAAYQRALEDSIFHPALSPVAGGDATAATPSPSPEPAAAADAGTAPTRDEQAGQSTTDVTTDSTTLSETARGFHTAALTRAFPSMPELFAVGDAPILQAHSVTDTLAAFVVRAVVMDPRRGFALDREFTKQDVERLISESVEAITRVGESAVMDTIRMQVFFDSAFPAQADHLHHEKMERQKACLPLLHDIVESRAKLTSQYEALYRKIVSFVLVKGHIGSATDVRAVKEATAALESVFPQSELNAFVALSRGEKEAQLNGLAQLVSGIRLFNKHLKKGGDSIVDVMSMCQSESDALASTILDKVVEAEAAIQTYSAIMEYSSAHPDNPLSGISISKVRALVIFYRQHLIYLQALQEQITASGYLLAGLKQTYDKLTSDLKDTCRSKSVVPVDQVYPQFISTANLWAGWYDELFLLAYRHGILEKIGQLASLVRLPIPPAVLASVEAFKERVTPDIQSDDFIVREATELGVAVSLINRRVDILHPLNYPQFHTAIVEYGGFCPYTIVHQEGVVLPGDRNLGLVRYRDKLMAFRSAAAIREFARRPDEVMQQVVERAKQSPDLIQLLQLYSYFPTVEALERAKMSNRQQITGRSSLNSDMGCQVDMHILDEYVDKSYHWNEWELRKRALMYVNLKSKLTHSTQTHASHFKRDNETQSYEDKGKGTQTMIHKGTNVAKPVSYLANLRHGGGASFKRIDLTLSLDGTPAPNRAGPFRASK